MSLAGIFFAYEALPPAASAATGSWAAFPWIVGGIIIFMLLVRLLGQILAATHPDPAPPQKRAAVSATGPQDAKKVTPVATPVEITCGEFAPIEQEIVAAISAALAAALPTPHRIVSIHPFKEPRTKGVESMMQQWSMEGRRQIYSSHRVR